MIPLHIQQLLDERGYSQRTDDKEVIRRTLVALGIDPASELGEFYLAYDPSLLQSDTSYEQLLDVVIPVVDGAAPVEADPSETPVGMATAFVRDVWEVPERMICLTTTEGEGAFLYDLSSGAIYDFSLSEQAELCNGSLSPRWNSFFEFIAWYLS
ncbi:MAG: hypothetical protein KatS3mg105_2041 [Gemmatales bacterium]|nr:MAG: hypothetical protein KatS3mg105_2041 [Gemmatales bacterium]